MIEKARCVNQGDLRGKRDGVHARERRRAGPGGVRVPIVAMKARNRVGAKGAQEGGDVNDQTTGNKSIRVSDWWTKQYEEAQAEIEINLRWSWVEPAVWTTRMLTALEKGVKGGKWFSLIDKVHAPSNLAAAFTKVKANDGAAGVDHRTIEMYEKDLEEKTWIVDADLKSYFDTIPHSQMAARVEEKIADGRVLKLISQFLKQGVLSEGKELEPEAGTPQGGVVSPLLANIYLNPLDHLMEQAGFEMTRYADDLVIMCQSEAEARQALELLQQWTAQAGLKLHPDKTRVVDATAPGGFDFLGYHFEQGQKRPRRKSLKKFKDRIRSMTKRNNGQSLERIIAALNRNLMGWFEYFKHSHYYIFRSIDSWIRMRLRSILRRRQGRRGRGRGRDNQRWPNAYFEAHGLFSLASAQARACQSSRR